MTSQSKIALKKPTPTDLAVWKSPVRSVPKPHPPRASAGRKKDKTRGTRALSKEQSDHVRMRFRQLMKPSAGKGLTQAELAKALGVSQQAINRILLGDAAGYYTVERLAAFDKVPPSTFLEGVPSLEDVLRQHRDRWDPLTAAQVRVLATEEAYRHYGESDWLWLLDELDVVTGKTRARLAKKE